MNPAIRLYKDNDLAELHSINSAGEPGVGAATQDALVAIIKQGRCFVATDAHDKALGFLVLLPPGAAYASQNYKWFEDRYEDYIYVDRIAISPQVRGAGLGAALYAHAFKYYSGKALLIACEVNITPPNPGSMRFHERAGFKHVGEQAFSDAYAVAYLARRLS